MGRERKKSPAIRRINLFGGPGCGKSTIAAYLFSSCKMLGYNVEHAQEYVKAWAFIGRPPTSFDQIYIFGKQMHREDIILRHDGSIVITESPIFLSTCYARMYKFPGHEHLIGLVDVFEQKYPSLNIFLDRQDLKYKSDGRFQDYKEALRIDRKIRYCMDEHRLAYEVVKYNDLETLKWLCFNAIE